jgi:hypothetical protein
VFLIGTASLAILACELEGECAQWCRPELLVGSHRAGEWAYGLLGHVGGAPLVLLFSPLA